MMTFVVYMVKIIKLHINTQKYMKKSVKKPVFLPENPCVFMYLPIKY